MKCPDAEPDTMTEKRARKCDEVADFEMPTLLAKKTKVTGAAPVQIGLQLFSSNSKFCPSSRQRNGIDMM